MKKTAQKDKDKDDKLRSLYPRREKGPQKEDHANQYGEEDEDEDEEEVEREA
ncbi:hypothetical protein [Aequorivita capsosiphonis]|uniref:hypothetical protein n=1 Tax=Aequorivita capsosiphonis TaxID=487317 RepID=UPI000420B5E7|nr:hypothetical protein [Aequorivita capsosiphonis]